jgi:hypothetical protein
MRYLILVVAAATLAACSSTPREHHWNPNAVPRDENWHSQTPSLLRYDANHDGTLTRAELLAGLHTEYDTYDTGHTNCLGPDQVRAINEMRVQQDASQATPLVDWNQDGCIDFNEYAGNTLSLFDTLDVNQDGQLSPQELKPAGARPPGQGGPQGSEGGHHGRGRRGGGGGPGQ